MTDTLVAIGLLIFEIVLFFWCRFIKQRFFNLNFLLKALGWLNWAYWICFNVAIWKDLRFILPYDLISGRSQADGICLIIAFIFSFVLCYQSSLIAYMNKRRKF
ncbi:hypothetical protein EV690_0091 [Celerinatantimonas diazotrophica]|uniref:Uncharacterized protein n=1 Tax=Celerinatantimonas diazotrophica TaxID=412034 RepID=A0A4R1KGU3_9GAMM|nr:hypothetical protein EV690_0091 [Celerinatantimonas diazotrophica]CAG9297062.1 hypothetical protein CEDIAZO_02224 [Celerinatantimonas diazotrophica]